MPRDPSNRSVSPKLFPSGTQIAITGGAFKGSTAVVVSLADKMYQVRLDNQLRTRVKHSSTAVVVSLADKMYQVRLDNQLRTRVKHKFVKKLNLLSGKDPARETFEEFEHQVMGVSSAATTLHEFDETIFESLEAVMKSLADLLRALHGRRRLMGPEHPETISIDDE
eukprot:CAMPEP_0172436660 /NCGR_PEP_ID=MMETSP1064-20121228/71840_1 /TAXON_ID=202472 /ORGANISM="Aulacoseira subarctica , Strain CCAP 1002/5" /LENGTH=166 /DNA_ID=CAMNT_0013185079 /DNA_START=734 /DNA_END=1234 /DNA_ORIENTATION=-